MESYLSEDVTFSEILFETIWFRKISHLSIQIACSSKQDIHTILWNAVTSLGENKVMYTPPPYFIVLASSVKIIEVKVIEFHRI